MWDLIVSVPDHCISFFLLISYNVFMTGFNRFYYPCGIRLCSLVSKCWTMSKCRKFHVILFYHFFMFNVCFKTKIDNQDDTDIQTVNDYRKSKEQFPQNWRRGQKIG